MKLYISLLKEMDAMEVMVIPVEVTIVMGCFAVVKEDSSTARFNATKATAGNGGTVTRTTAPLMDPNRDGLVSRPTICPGLLLVSVQIQQQELPR